MAGNPTTQQIFTVVLTVEASARPYSEQEIEDALRFQREGLADIVVDEQFTAGAGA